MVAVAITSPCDQICRPVDDDDEGCAGCGGGGGGGGLGFSTVGISIVTVAVGAVEACELASLLTGANPPTPNNAFSSAAAESCVAIVG